MEATLTPDGSACKPLHDYDTQRPLKKLRAGIGSIPRFTQDQSWGKATPHATTGEATGWGQEMLTHSQPPCHFGDQCYRKNPQVPAPPPGQLLITYQLHPTFPNCPPALLSVYLSA